MAEHAVARGPVRPASPVVVRDGWEVSGRRSHGPLRLADHSPLTKVLVRAHPGGQVASRLGVPFGRAARNAAGVLVVGAGPGEWLLVAAPGIAGDIAGGFDRADDHLVTVLDLTHGRALLRLSGARADAVLGKICAIDLSDRRTPDATAFRSSVARLATDVIRDDVGGVRSYLLHCERSSGQYLFDALLDAGREFGIEPDGFDHPEE